MPVLRQRKARDEHGKCGNQSADESVINRRPIGSRHTCQVEILRHRCKIGAEAPCDLTAMTDPILRSAKDRRRAFAMAFDSNKLFIGRSSPQTTRQRNQATPSPWSQSAIGGLTGTSNGHKAPLRY